MFAELGRDALNRTGRFHVVEGIISPVSDHYKKKVRFGTIVSDTKDWIMNHSARYNSGFIFNGRKQIYYKDIYICI